MKRQEPTSTPNGHTVLYLEPRESFREAVADRLNHAGYAVIFADDFEEAEQHLKGHTEKITITLCCGRVKTDDDGKAWAAKQHKTGETTVIVAEQAGERDVPFVARSQTWNLLPTLEEILGELPKDK